ncbi:biotin-dependent carboxyltransferase family protein [Thalassotalea psychrophila]|uniref:Biotin-dependent carboxyltransferase family protein n=1 Tax=Thalassotalea psychrophila TaxID=3065647 RepID=A0ABY9TS01_9GAMM|nr:biotin-dependent carboxyltransferase family protein [Colwelliaceae bacterium SQ149]
MNESTSLGFRVINPGMLTLIQDLGRFGCHSIGLTIGGPLDSSAFKWANKLCANADNTSCLEITFGGLELEVQLDTTFCVTGAKLPLTINGQTKPQWQSLSVYKGDIVKLGFVSEGMHAYLAVAGGFNIKPTFNSVSTVVREGVGGFDGGKILQGQVLPYTTSNTAHHNKLNKPPTYDTAVSLRVILGYQHEAFSQVQKGIFFSGKYSVSQSCDRMGYRLNGPKTKPSIDGILSEGICLGAIQVPADGQPIVLMNDRQTIGGYPKIGSVLSIDLAKLAQCGPGATVTFEEISIEQAHNILHIEMALIELNPVEPIELLLN